MWVFIIGCLLLWSLILFVVYKLLERFRPWIRALVLIALSWGVILFWLFYPGDTSEPISVTFPPPEHSDDQESIGAIGFASSWEYGDYSWRRDSCRFKYDTCVCQAVYPYHVIDSQFASRHKLVAYFETDSLEFFFLIDWQERTPILGLGHHPGFYGYYQISADTVRTVSVDYHLPLDREKAIEVADTLMARLIADRTLYCN